jgi:uncharacterized protein YoxC
MGAPSRVQQDASRQIDEATAYIQELEEAIVAIDQQAQELLAEYNEAVALLEALKRGKT